MQLLHLLVGGRLLLADQEHRLVGQLRAAVDRAHDRVDQVVAVQVGLAAGDVAGEQVGGRQPLEDARDLLGDEGGPAVLVIDAGEAQDRPT